MRTFCSRRSFRRFPLRSIAAFGLRGAYLWPALAFLALVPLLASARRQLLPETSWAVLAFIVVAANPLLLYALEFWEHAPAVALLAAGTAVVAPSFVRDLLGGARRPPAARSSAPASCCDPRGRGTPPGLALALGPRRWLPFGRRGRRRAAARRRSELPALRHAARRPCRRGARAHRLGDFLATRWQRVLDWLWPASAADAIGLALVAAAWVGRAVQARRARRGSCWRSPAPPSSRCWRHAGRCRTQSFWQGFPLALLTLMPTSAWTPTARRLALAALVAVAGVVLTATNDGGAQWGTRYLLIAAPPLLLLAARAPPTRRARARGGCRGLRSWR